MLYTKFQCHQLTSFGVEKLVMTFIIHVNGRGGHIAGNQVNLNKPPFTYTKASSYEILARLTCGCEEDVCGC